MNSFVKIVHKILKDVNFLKKIISHSQFRKKKREKREKNLKMMKKMKNA